MLLPGCALCLSPPCGKAVQSPVIKRIQIRSPALWSPGWANDVVPILDYLKQEGMGGRTEKAACNFAVLGQKNEHPGTWLCGGHPRCCPSSSWCPTLLKERSGQRNPTQDLVCTRREKPIVSPPWPTNQSCLRGLFVRGHC